MSLLDTGNEIVLIWPEIEDVDPDGNPIRTAAPDPVTVRGRVQPVSSTDVIAAGQQTATRYRLSSRTAPLGPWARVGWDGRYWDVEGEPLNSNGSRRTRHVVAILKARGQPERSP